MIGWQNDRVTEWYDDPVSEKTRSTGYLSPPSNPQHLEGDLNVPPVFPQHCEWSQASCALWWTQCLTRQWHLMTRGNRPVWPEIPLREQWQGWLMTWMAEKSHPHLCCTIAGRVFLPPQRALTACMRSRWTARDSYFCAQGCLELQGGCEVTQYRQLASIVNRFRGMPLAWRTRTGTLPGPNGRGSVGCHPQCGFRRWVCATREGCGCAGDGRCTVQEAPSAAQSCRATPARRTYSPATYSPVAGCWMRLGTGL